MASLYRRQRNNSGGADPFIDLLFNTLLGFTLLFLVSLLFINPKAKRGSVDMVAEYIITATWPKNLADDIDRALESALEYLIETQRPDGAIADHRQGPGQGFHHLLDALGQALQGGLLGMPGPFGGSAWAASLNTAFGSLLDTQPPDRRFFI